MKFHIGTFNGSTFRNVLLLLSSIILVYIFWNVYAVNTNKSVLNKLLQYSENITNNLASIQTEISKETTSTATNTRKSAEQEIDLPEGKPPSKFNYDAVECYRFAHKNTTPITFFADIMDTSHALETGRVIFFTETSCADDGIARLGPR